MEMSSPILQGISLVFAAPALTGWIIWFKARMQGRPRSWIYIFQPYLNLITLFRTPAVRPMTTSWVFRATPWILFASYAWLMFIIPVFAKPLLVIDFIVVIYVLGLGRFVLSLAGWDAGNAFGGLGGSREMFLHFLTEIGLILFFAALTLRWDTINLNQIFDYHAQILLDIMNQKSFEDQKLILEFFKDIGLVFLAISLALIILFEAERLPIDNPDTHLELAMTHKAVLLEFAGGDLALIKWAEMIKLMFLFSLFSNLFLPVHNLWQGFQIPLFTGEMLLLGCLLVVWELRQARTRLREVSRFAWTTLLFSLISIILTVATRRILP
jgi:formate hydrogenlyase subunit 4